jgi:hypothetical protein
MNATRTLNRSALCLSFVLSLGLLTGIVATARSQSAPFDPQSLVGYWKGQWVLESADASRGTMVLASRK